MIFSKKYIKKIGSMALAGVIAVSSVSLGTTKLVFAQEEGAGTTSEQPVATNGNSNYGEDLGVRLENNNIYNVNVVMKKSGQSDKSMAGNVLNEKAQVFVDENGKLFIRMNFQMADIMGVKINASDFKFYDEGGQFIEGQEYVIDENKNAIFTSTLSDFKFDGIYKGKVFSTIMSSDVDIFIDWTRAVKEENFMGSYFIPLMGKAINLSQDKYTEESFAPLQEILNKAQEAMGENEPTKKMLFDTYNDVGKAMKKLIEKPTKVFDANSRFFVDISGDNELINNLLEKEGEVVTDENGVSKLIIKFKPFNPSEGESYNIESIVVKDKNLQPVENQESSEIEKGRGSHTFQLPYIDDGGNYIADILIDNIGEANAFTIHVDWSSKYTGADLRPLRAEVEEAKKLKKEDYTTKSFEAFAKVLDEARAILDDENPDRNLVKELTEKLKQAQRALSIVENEGKGRNINKGLDGLNNPFAGKVEEDSSKEWAGSRIFFGGHTWLMLDKETGLVVMEDSYLISPMVSNESTETLESGWEKSKVRKMLNTEFVENTFSDDEKSVILNSDIETSYNVSRDNNIFKIVEKTKDKVFLLSADDYMNNKYGFKGDNSRKKGEKYWIRNKVDVNNFDSYVFKYIDEEGALNNLGYTGTGDFKVFPAMHIDTSKIAYTKIYDSSIIDKETLPLETKENKWTLGIVGNYNTELDGLKLENNILTGMVKTNMPSYKVIAVVTEKKMERAVEVEPINGKILKVIPVDVKGDKFSLTMPESYDKNKEEVYIIPITESQSGSDILAIPAWIDWEKVQLAENEDAAEKTDEAVVDEKTNKNSEQTAEGRKETKEKDEKTNTPKTGDHRDVAGAGLGILGSLGFVSLLVFRKDKGNKNY